MSSRFWGKLVSQARRSRQGQVDRPKTRWTKNRGLAHAAQDAPSCSQQAKHTEHAYELPVQVPVKFDLAINIKAAKALGITIPESFLLRADEVIE